MKRKLGTWEKDAADRGIIRRGSKFHIRFADANGKLREESAGPSKAFAKKLLERRRTEVQTMKYFPEQARKKVTFADLIDAALENTKSEHRKAPR
jgi:hypothetical protein